MHKTPKTRTDGVLPFRGHFEILAAEPDERTDAWRSTTASLFVLRLTERLLTEQVPSEDDDEQIGREIINAVRPHSPLSLALGQALLAVAEGKYANLARALRDLGRVLWSDAAWTQSVDVFDMAARVAHLGSATELMLECRLGTAYAYRMMRSLDDAAARYIALDRAAARIGNVRYSLEGQLGLAKIAIDLNDIARARRLHCVPVQSKALIDAARIAGERKDYVRALAYSYEALVVCEDTRERDRIMVNVGRSLIDLGHRDAGRDASLLILATAQETETRIVAGLNLMEVAALDRNTAAFDDYRRSMDPGAMLPLHAAWYYEWVGAGCAQLGRMEEAEIGYMRMHAVAMAHGFDALADAAREGRERVSAGADLPVRASDSSPDVVRIAAAITHQRIAAGISAG